MKEISEKEFTTILELITTTTGLLLPDTNYSLVKRFLLERCAYLDVDMAAYILVLKKNPQEQNSFLNAVTIGETYLFREEKHFNILHESIIPGLIDRVDKVKLWSAACSEGPESVSLAALFFKNKKLYPQLDFEVYCSDLNSDALEAGKKGELRKNFFRHDGEKYHSLLDPYLNKENDKISLTDEIKAKMKIYQVNLYTDNFNEIPNDIHIVFLRNVFIYMANETRTLILKKVVRKMAYQGYLFLSSSEVPLVAHEQLAVKEFEGSYFFQKISFNDRTNNGN